MHYVRVCRLSENIRADFFKDATGGLPRQPVTDLVENSCLKMFPLRLLFASNL